MPGDEFKAHPADCFCNPNRAEHLKSEFTRKLTGEGRNEPAEVVTESNAKRVVPEPKEHPLGLEGEESKKLEAFWAKKKNERKK